MAESCVNEARQLASSGSYARAFDMYITAFEQYPDLKPGLDPEFRLLLNKLNEVLVATNKIAQIFNNFERAINAFPSNAYIFNDIGKYLYKFGYFQEACCHFQKALKFDSGNVAAERNLNNVKNLLIERWHFRMLNDKIRNDAYRNAIHEAIACRKDSVLDLGSGTGLLTMYAKECEPKAATAVEASETMTDLSRCIMNDNHLTAVLLVNAMSTTLKYCDIGGRRNLIITELFDAGLFGEHILETLVHAWEQLIVSPRRVVPARAEFFVAGVKCDHLNLKYQLSPSAKAVLNIPNLSVHISTADPYDSDDVHQIDEITYLTEPHSLLNVYFNDAEDMKKILSRNEPYDIALKAKETGEVNMIIGWFNLHLNENVMITTNPVADKRANAWQQAVFFDFIPTHVQKDTTIPVQFTSVGGKLALMRESSIGIIRISSEMLRFLNDSDYIKMITECVGTVCIYLGQMAEMSQLSMVDLCPFPIFGLIMMLRGADSLICFAKNREDKSFIRKVFKKNKICTSKVKILVGDELIHIESFTGEKFHLIYTNILDTCGEVNVQRKELARHLRNAHLLPGGLVLPFKIDLEAQIVSSRWLDINNRVYDENVHGYKIAESINKYQVSHNIDIDLAHLQYTPISEPVTIAAISSGISPDLVSVPIINDGDANAIICWYTIQLMENGKSISTKRANSFVDGMAFLANPAITMKKGTLGIILRCVDSDGIFKLVIDPEIFDVA